MLPLPDDFGEEEGDADERINPVPRPWRPADQLAPAPPPGWFLVYRFFSRPPPCYANETALWIHLVYQAQRMAQLRGERLHMIARTAANWRALLVHPCAEHAMAEVLDQHEAHEHNCGCLDHFQYAEEAYHALLHMKWRDLSLPARLKLLAENGLAPRLARLRFKNLSEDEQNRLFEDGTFQTE